MAKVLVVDDEANLRKVLAASCAATATRSPSPRTASRASPSSSKNGTDIVVTDLGMPKVDGHGAARAPSTPHNPDVPVIMITAHGTVDTAVEALKLGAFDYITKPFEQDELRPSSPRRSKTHDVAPSARCAPDAQGARARIIGESPQMQEVFAIIDKVADTPSTVLITGESGTGKELVARALHEQLSRARQAVHQGQLRGDPQGR